MALLVSDTMVLACGHHVYCSLGVIPSVLKYIIEVLRAYQSP